MASPNLTERDREIMVMAWQSFKAQPQVDYEKLREMGGFKTTASANAVYLAVRKKLLSGQSATLSPRDREIIVMAWQCFKTAAEVDYKQLQQKGKFKTTASANAVYLAVKKKLLASMNSGEGEGASTPKKGGGDGKKRKKAAVEYETPAKRTKKDSAVDVKTDVAVEDEREGDAMAKVKDEPDAGEDENDGLGQLFSDAYQYLDGEREGEREGEGDFMGKFK